MLVNENIMDTSFAVQCPPFKLQLSHWDKRMGPLYSQRILCFPLSNNSDEHKAHITQLLLTALKSTVEKLPWLAGSVVSVAKDIAWLYNLRPQGAAYLEVKDLSSTINFQDLRKAQFSPTLLDNKQLCPFPEAIYIRDHPVDVCRLRANFVEGGLLLVVSIIHTVSDGRGITEFLKIFAEMFRNSQTGELTSRSIKQEETPKHTYSFDRTSILSGNGFSGALENHPAWTTSPYRPLNSSLRKTTSCTIFHISSDSLPVLKQVALPSSHSAPALAAHQAPRISTHDAIAALIWRSIMLARRRAGIISDNISTQFCTAVDCRSHLNLPTPYFGNAIYPVKTSLAIPQLAPTSANDSFDVDSDSELKTAARNIREQINGVTADGFRDLLAFAERTEAEFVLRLSVWDDMSVGSLILVSYFWFEMHELDFGNALGGKIEAFRLPSGGLVPGMPVVLPRLPDGSCEFVVYEEEEVMKFLREDKLLRRFASECC